LPPLRYFKFKVAKNNKKIKGLKYCGTQPKEEGRYLII